MNYQRGNYQDKWRIERLAAEIRARIGLNQLDVLDPNALVDHFNVRLFHLRDLCRDEVALHRARRVGFDGAASAHPETGELMILLNCGKPERRRTATLMEELAHLILQHKPSRIEPDEQIGLVRREFDRSQEQEAYDLGSAMLLPKERIQRDVKEHQALAEAIADAHACSTDLVAYRIRRLRLWNRYTTYARAAS